MATHLYLLELKRRTRLWLLSLLIPFLLSADSQFVTTAKRAEKLFYEKLYGDALPLYSQLLTFSPDEDLKTQLTLRLATCHLEEGQPEIALAILTSLEPYFYRNQCLFLMSLAYRQLGESSRALSVLQQCSLPNSQHTRNLIALERGYHYMQMGDLTNAQFAFESIPLQIADSLPYDLAQLQLAKIFLMQHQVDKALQALSLLSLHLPPQQPLNIERMYLTGWALLANHQASQAAMCFEELLPKALASQANWSTHVLNGLILSYLRQALVLAPSSDQLNDLFFKTEHTLQQLFKRTPSETSYLLLSDFYLIKAKCLGDPASYALAQQLLDQSELFSSQDSLRLALLKRAAAAPSYQERSRLYEELSINLFRPLEDGDRFIHLDHPAFCAKVWFLKGLNDLEEGLRRQQELKRIEVPFERAIQAFNQAIQFAQHINPIETALAIKYLACAHAHLPGEHHAQQAWHILTQLIADDSLLSTFEHPEEIYCLSAWIALHLTDKEILQKARLLLQQSQEGEYKPSWKERCLKLEGLICLQLKEWEQADLIFASLLQDQSSSSLYPPQSNWPLVEGNSGAPSAQFRDEVLQPLEKAANLTEGSIHGEAWFWRAYCADQQQNLSLKKEYLQHAFQDSQSPYAPIAYFHFYSYREYMQGRRKAIKHLQAMPLLFPHHPLLITAYYLLGLNHTKDHLSEEGQIVRRKDLTTAIDAFQLAESTFDTLFEKTLIPPSELAYFIQIRYRAQLERAQANLAIAQNSTGGKKQIYLKYAEEVFKHLIQDFITPQALAKEALIQPFSPYPTIWAEAEFQLAKTYKEKNEWQAADSILNESLEHYRQAQINQGYGFMRLWYEKGKLAQRLSNDQAALQCFLEAEKSSSGLLGLSPNDKLDLWIQQSLCYKSLNQLDHSMRLLSRVINDDVISPLRIKAMFLRAEIYELQGRPELAIKQLEATARKGGEWAKKAQEKLEQAYGY
jgi:predicted negative regulator of RcsB-dependent stress response